MKKTHLLMFSISVLLFSSCFQDKHMKINVYSFNTNDKCILANITSNIVRSGEMLMNETVQNNQSKNNLLNLSSDNLKKASEISFRVECVKWKININPGYIKSSIFNIPLSEVRQHESYKVEVGISNDGVFINEPNKN